MNNYIKLSLMSLFFLLILYTPDITNAATYYISPTGNDSNNGISQVTPLATFNKAWEILQPGDTIYLMDGTYYQVIEPTINGISGSPITIKALNDGKAIINGEFQRHTVVIGRSWDFISNPTNSTPNPYGNYFQVEGLIAKNSIADVYEIYARNVSLKRCSGYNANPHDNFHVITVWAKGSPTSPANILIEDCVVAGSGRKMIIDYDTYVNVVFRRNFAAWQWWLGDQFCQGYWPQSQGIENYPAAYQDQPIVTLNDLRENNITFGLAPDGPSSFSPNPGLRIGNKMLGEITLGGGMKWDNIEKKFITPYFNPDSCQYNGTDANHTKPAICGTDSRCISTGSELGIGVDYAIFGTPSLRNNLIQDLFSAYNGDMGFTAGPWGNNYGTTSNNQLIRATFVQNGLASYSPHKNIDVFSSSLTPFNVVQNLQIGNMSGTNPAPGTGAQLQYRYIDGVLTDEPLWPWPMEERIKSEFADPTLFQANGVQGQVWTDFSVTNTVYPILSQYGAVSTTLPSPFASSLPSPSMTPFPSPNPADVNGSGGVDFNDLKLILSNWLGLGSCATFVCDLNSDSKINAWDASLVIANWGN